MLMCSLLGLVSGVGKEPGPSRQGSGQARSPLDHCCKVMLGNLALAVERRVAQ